MARLTAGKVLFAALAFAVAGGLVYAVSDNRQPTTVSHAEAASQATGQSSGAAPGTVTGLPLPRFVSLKSERVNVRRGPSNGHGVAWVFTRKSLPVEIIAEFDHWRRIRDSDGAEGWVYHSLLSGQRTVIVAPWAKGEALGLLRQAAPDAARVANLVAGVVGILMSCDGKWCETRFGDYQGFVPQDKLFGVYPGETYDN